MKCRDRPDQRPNVDPTGIRKWLQRARDWKKHNPLKDFRFCRAGG